jgi:hypothetical protein
VSVYRQLFTDLIITTGRTKPTFSFAFLPELKHVFMPARDIAYFTENMNMLSAADECR